MKKSVAIVVSSYDKLELMWDNFFMLLAKYLPNKDINIYLINNHLKFQQKNLEINVINTGEERGWRTRILKGLEKIDEKYIVFFVEDYLVGDTVKENELFDLIGYMEENNIKMCRLMNTPKTTERLGNISYLAPIYANQRYGIALQCAIWEKEEFIKNIKKLDGETPWDFEKYFLKNCHEKKKEVVKGYIVDKRDIFNIKHGLSKGKWLNSTLNHFEKNGIKLNLCNRKKMTRVEEMRMNIKKLITRCIPGASVIKMKKILKKIGINSTTEY